MMLYELNYQSTTVESGLDDPDNLGHFLVGQVRT